MNLEADTTDHLAQTSALPLTETTFTTEKPDIFAQTEALSFTNINAGPGPETPFE
jgi:hypothetical protein